MVHCEDKQMRIHRVSANRQAIGLTPNCWVISLNCDLVTAAYDERASIQELLIQSWDIKSIKYIGLLMDSYDNYIICQYYVQFADDATEAQFIIDKDKIIGEL